MCLWLKPYVNIEEKLRDDTEPEENQTTYFSPRFKVIQLTFPAPQIIYHLCLKYKLVRQDGVKMQKHDSRIALRLPSNERQQIEQLIREGKYQNISQVIRAALSKFLQDN